MQQYLTIWDLILTPVYLIILAAIAKNWRNKHYPPKHPMRKYYLPGLYVKLGGCIFIALIYAYYYKGGDTYNFFAHSKIINSALDDSFVTWYKLLTRQSVSDNPELYPYVSQLYFYEDPASYTVTTIGAVLGLLNGTSYLPTALLFAFLSYTGIWAMYRTFSNLYPKLIKQLALAFLFIPSTFVWGSAIFKDTLCMFGLGWMIYSTFRIFINADFSLKNLGMLVLSFYLIAVVKIYILLGFVPALSLWLLLSYSKKIKSVAVRWIVNILFMGVTVAGFLFFTERFAKELNRYSLEEITKTAETSRAWITYASGEEGSAYDLGEFDPSFTGMLTKFPQAVVVTLFRPFIWEAKKVIVVLSAVEALLFLFFTLKVIFTRLKSFRLLSKDPNLLFCFIFSIVFAFAVGISSYNFGALSRYKIPCLPFYAAFLLILLHSKIPKHRAILVVKQVSQPKQLTTTT